jgi:hypothetical protein
MRKSRFTEEQITYAPVNGLLCDLRGKQSGTLFVNQCTA